MKPIIRRRSESGFTLIELMIVAAILGIITIPLMTMAEHAATFKNDHERFTRAAAVLSTQMELLKTEPYAARKAGKNYPLDPAVAGDLARLRSGRGTVAVSDMPGRPGLRRIEVTVEWVNPWGKPRSLRSVTLRAGP